MPRRCAGSSTPRCPARSRRAGGRARRLRRVRSADAARVAAGRPDHEPAATADDRRGRRPASTTRSRSPPAPGHDGRCAGAPSVSARAGDRYCREGPRRRQPAHRRRTAFRWRHGPRSAARRREATSTGAGPGSARPMPIGRGGRRAGAGAAGRRTGPGAADGAGRWRSTCRCRGRPVRSSPHGPRSSRSPVRAPVDPTRRRPRPHPAQPGRRGHRSTGHDGRADRGTFRRRDPSGAEPWARSSTSGSSALGSRRTTPISSARTIAPAG